MKINIFLFLTFLCALCKAQTVADEVINIDVKVADLLHVDKMSDIIKDIRYVPINDSVPLNDLSPFAMFPSTGGSIQYIGENLSIVSNRILTNTDGVFAVFNFSGNLLFSLNNKGKGPNEYIRINAMTYDLDSDKYYLACDRKIIELDGLGHVLRSIPYPKDGYHTFIRGIKEIRSYGDYLALSGEHPASNCLIDKNGNFINSLSKNENKVRDLKTPADLNYYITNNDLLCSDNCGNTICKVSGTDLKPYLNFSFDENYYYYSCLLETSSHFAFTMTMYENVSHKRWDLFDSFCVKSKRSAKIYELTRKTKRDCYILDKAWPLLPCWYTEKDELIVVLSAQKFLNNMKHAEDDGIKSLFYAKAKAVAQNITENSNPIIVFIELKDKI